MISAPTKATMMASASTDAPNRRPTRLVGRRNPKGMPMSSNGDNLHRAPDPGELLAQAMQRHIQGIGRDGLVDAPCTSFHGAAPNRFPSGPHETQHDLQFRRRERHRLALVLHDAAVLGDSEAA